LADDELVRRIASAKFAKTSQEWAALADRLAAYGYFVLVAWGITGRLHEKALKHRGGSRIPKGLALDVDEAHALAHELLLVSLEKFRTTSLSLWNPKGGACLTTFFVGRCLMDLPDVYEKWDARERQRWRDYERWTDAMAPVDDGRHIPHPEQEVEVRLLVDELLENDPDLRMVLELRDQGLSWEEIAALSGEETGCVRTRAHRAMQRIRRAAE
jgi:hypothetical protein